MRFARRLKRVCLEPDTDVSKYVRIAIEDRVRADYRRSPLVQQFYRKVETLSCLPVLEAIKCLNASKGRSSL
jgi:hypothetical protein